MCPEGTPVTGRRDSGRRAQHGFAIVSAIFLLVVLGTLGAFMVALSTVQHTTSTQDLQGTRAYQAARAGIEWGAYQVLTPEHANPVGVSICLPGGSDSAQYSGGFPGRL